MKFCLSSFKDFKNILMTAELVMNEIKFEVDNDGLRLKGMDGGKTSFFSADFKREYFDEYSIDAPETITVDASELNKVMKRIKNTDEVCATINNEGMSLRVNGTKTFKINALNSDMDTPNLPNMEFPVKAIVDFEDFKDSVNDSKLYSDAFSIESRDGNIMVSANGVLGDYESELLVGDEIVDGCKSVFRSDLIISFFKLGDLSDRVNVNMGTNFPILMVVTDELDEATVKLLVAPRIEEY